jgi:predicted RNase H-like HicB family nuclease
MYRIGFPGWKVAARLHWPLKVVVHVHHDKEAAVYFAHSPDLRGLVVEAKTLEALRDEVRAATVELLDAEFNGHRPQASPELRFQDSAL